MAEHDPTAGSIVIGVEGQETMFGSGTETFAHYERPLYRRRGLVRAVQISEPFEIWGEDESSNPVVIDEGEAGDWLAGPNEEGNFFVIPELQFSEEWELAPEEPE